MKSRLYIVTLRQVIFFIGEDKGGRYLAKIGDFGQATFDFGQFSVSQATSLSCTITSKQGERNRVGTAPYTAPELIDVGAKRSCQSDVYSFGMVMVEFTLPDRSHPWEGEISSCDLIYHHVKKGKRPTIDPTRLDGLPEDKQSGWLSILRSCWAHDIEDRQTFNDKR